MKRYWLSITLVVFIVLCVGTFYIQATASHLPEFVLIKQQGAEEEVEGVLVRGLYGQGHMKPTVTVSSAGSEYANERSFFERLDPYYWAGEEIRQLVKEHRHFMRGKRADGSFYQDDNYLVYVNIEQDGESARRVENFNFNVSVMDKKQNNTLSYEVRVPDGNLYGFINVQDVQVFGDEIIIVTEGYTKTGGRSEFHRYSLGLKDDKVLTDQVIDFSNLDSTNKDVNYNVQRAYESNLTQPSKFNVFYIELTKAAAENDNTGDAEAKRTQEFAQEIVSAHMMVYDLQTGQSEKINSPELSDFLGSQSGADSMNFNTEGDILYMTNRGPQGIRVIEYNIPDAKGTLHEIQADAVISSEIKDHRLNMLTRDDKSSSGQPSLVIVDLDSGEWVYQGSIGLRGTDQYQKDEMQKLNINQLVVK